MAVLAVATQQHRPRQGGTAPRRWYRTLAMSLILYERVSYASEYPSYAMELTHAVLIALKSRRNAVTTPRDGSLQSTTWASRSFSATHLHTGRRTRATGQGVHRCIGCLSRALRVLTSAYPLPKLYLSTWPSVKYVSVCARSLQQSQLRDLVKDPPSNALLFRMRKWGCCHNRIRAKTQL
jgi:hypothetical protein